MGCEQTCEHSLPRHANTIHNRMLLGTYHVCEYLPGAHKPLPSFSTPSSHRPSKAPGTKLLHVFAQYPGGAGGGGIGGGPKGVGGGDGEVQDARPVRVSHSSQEAVQRAGGTLSTQRFSLLLASRHANGQPIRVVQ